MHDLSTIKPVRSQRLPSHTKVRHGFNGVRRRHHEIVTKLETAVPLQANCKKNEAATLQNYNCLSHSQHSKLLTFPCLYVEFTKTYTYSIIPVKRSTAPSGSIQFEIISKQLLKLQLQRLWSPIQLVLNNVYIRLALGHISANRVATLLEMPID